jgi:hypothetical protein
MQRREFLTSALIGGMALIAPGATAADTTPAPAGRRGLWVAGLQMLVAEHDVAANELAIHRAIDRAATEGTEFLLTPESGLSDYHVEFDQQVVAGAVERLREHARASRVGLLLGTGYREPIKDTIGGAPSNGEACYNQVRVYTQGGEYLGFHREDSADESDSSAGHGRNAVVRDHARPLSRCCGNAGAEPERLRSSRFAISAALTPSRPNI